jgi:hypothetical protein
LATVAGQQLRVRAVAPPPPPGVRCRSIVWYGPGSIRTTRTPNGSARGAGPRSPPAPTSTRGTDRRGDRHPPGTGSERHDRAARRARIAGNTARARSTPTTLLRAGRAARQARSPRAPYR